MAKPTESLVRQWKAYLARQEDYVKQLKGVMQELAEVRVRKIRDKVAELEAQLKKIERTTDKCVT